MLRLDIINEWTWQNGIKLDESQLELLSAYQERVLEVNKRMNLTAITDNAEFAVKHFIDSLTLLPLVPKNARLLDAGTGAGFPGIPLKISRQDIKLTLMDSLRKRIFFLRETADLLQLSDVDCVHARAEEVNRKPEYNSRFDICAARAVAKLSLLAEYLLPFLKPGGLLLAMKGRDISEEIDEARSAVKKHRAEVIETRETDIGMGIRHSIVVIRKT